MTPDGAIGSLSYLDLHPVEIRPDHRLEYCTLPRPRRRWLGLVAACVFCGRTHALRAYHRPGALRVGLRWEPLEAARENR